MTKYRESKAPVTTSTYNRSKIEKGVDNIYEAIIFLKTVRYYSYYGFFIIVGFLTVCLMKLFYDSKQQLVWLKVIIHLNIVMNVLPFSCLKELVLVL